MCEGLLSVERAVCTWGPSPWGHPMLLLTLTLTLTLTLPLILTLTLTLN